MATKFVRRVVWSELALDVCIFPVENLAVLHTNVEIDMGDVNQRH